MHWIHFIGIALITMAITAFAHAAETAAINPVAEWTFDVHDLAKDTSGHGHDGEAHDVARAARGSGTAGSALSFDGSRSYVQVGPAKDLDLRGALTLEAWICPRQRPSGLESCVIGKSYRSFMLTYYTGGAVYFYIGSNEQFVTASVQPDRWTHVVGTFDGDKTITLYIDGLAAAIRGLADPTVHAAGALLIGCTPQSAEDVERFDDRKIEASEGRGFYEGLLDEIRVYDRAISAEQVSHRYRGAAQSFGHDTSGFDRFAVATFAYPEGNRIVVDVDARGMMPITDEPTMTIELVDANGTVRATQPVEHVEPTGVTREIVMNVKDLPQGAYDLRVSLTDGRGARPTGTFPVRYEAAAAQLPPAPDERIAAPLPAQAGPPKYELSMTPHGGFVLTVEGKRFPVSSRFSYPHGGENRLAADDDQHDGQEEGWKVQASSDGNRQYRVQAAGKHYAIDRLVEAQPHRILVRDRIVNLTDAPIGIMLRNTIDFADAGPTKVLNMDNPALFAHGLGLIALDDVFQVQLEKRIRETEASIGTQTFGLDAKADYTLEWAIYPTTSADKWEFVNRVRADEVVTRTVEGCWASWLEWSVPDAEFMRTRNVKYANVGYLKHIVDDPGITVDGFEFREYPLVSQKLAALFGATRKAYPHVQVMTHLAHSLYATNNPMRFADSRVIDAEGKQTIYGDTDAYYQTINYFSKERLAQGWRWYIYYPTLTNSYGQAMLEAVDHLLDSMGATGVFADGLTHCYGGHFTYDRWDGHTVEIDPETKTIRRQYGSVLLLSRDALVEMLQRVEKRGGIVVNNGRPGPRSFWSQNMICTEETRGGSERAIERLYFAPTITALGDPWRMKSQRDVYDDILTKLDHGALYFYYDTEKLDFTYGMLPDHMYPITTTDVRPGVITGKERILTTRSGVYGWNDDASLHAVYRYDGRGAPAKATNAVSTVDSRGTRTELELSPNESAAIVKLPVTLNAGGPVNIVVDQYDDDQMALRLNGKGPVKLSFDGATDDALLRVLVNDREVPVPITDDRAIVSTHLDGLTTVRVTREH
jgi:hypothetical protein